MPAKGRVKVGRGVDAGGMQPAIDRSAPAPSIFESATPDFAARMAAAEGGSATREAIIRAAMNLFAEYGYHASTLRRLAERVGIEAGSLYNHISSKSELLSGMLVFGTHEVLAGVAELLETAPGAATERLRVAVTAHIQFHCVQREQVLVLDREFRALTGDHAAETMRGRIEYEQLFREILEQGVREGLFHDHDISLSSKAILRLGTGTAAWFRLDGRAPAREIGDFYADMMVRALSAPSSYRKLYKS